MGHNYIDHNYMGHNWIGHNCIGHNYIGDTYIDDNYIVAQVLTHLKEKLQFVQAENQILKVGPWHGACVSRLGDGMGHVSPLCVHACPGMCVDTCLDMCRYICVMCNAMQPATHSHTIPVPQTLCHEWLTNEEKTNGRPNPSVPPARVARRLT